MDSVQAKPGPGHRFKPHGTLGSNLFHFQDQSEECQIRDLINWFQAELATKISKVKVTEKINSGPYIISVEDAEVSMTQVSHYCGCFDMQTNEL